MSKNGVILGLALILVLLLAPPSRSNQNTEPNDTPWILKFDASPKKLEKNRINFVTITFKFKDEKRNLFKGEFNINHIFRKAADGLDGCIYPEGFWTNPPRPGTYSTDSINITHAKYILDHRKFKKKVGTFKICYGILPRKWKTAEVSAWLEDAAGNKGARGEKIYLAKELQPIGKKQGRRIGDYAYDFTLLNNKRKPVSFSDYKGKVILLAFSTMWSSPCQREASELEELYQTYKAQGFIIFHILTERQDHHTITPKDADKRQRQYDLTFPVTADCFWGVYNAYTNFPKIRTIPLNILIDKNGIIRWRETGWDLIQRNKIETKIQELLAE